jgi:hypothetical protein
MGLFNGQYETSKTIDILTAQQYNCGMMQKAGRWLAILPHQSLEACTYFSNRMCKGGHETVLDS